MPVSHPSLLFFAFAMLEVLCAGIFFYLRHSLPGEIRGLRHWGSASLVSVVAGCMALLANHLPPPLAATSPDMLQVSGIMLLHAGLLQFGNRAPDRLLVTAMLATMGILLLWPPFSANDPLRAAAVSIVVTMLLLACAASILKMPGKSFAELLTGASFAFAALLSSLRHLDTFSLAPPHHGEHGQVVRLLYLNTLATAMIAAKIGLMLMACRKFQQHLEHIASRDELTGTYTRGAYFDLVGKEIARTRRSGAPLALLMLDLDNFKQINDRHGHVVGDKVLVDFAQKVNRVLRTQDIFGRYGGEEFSILLPNTPQADAYRVGARICRLLEEARVPGIPPYTVSIGLATMQYQDQLDLEGFIRHADAALYQAKSGGKSRVEIHPEKTLKFV